MPDKTGYGDTAENLTFPAAKESKLVERSVVDDPLVPQLFEELADVGANLLGVRVAELGLQLCDDLAEGALAIAALEDRQGLVSRGRNALFRIEDRAF